MNPLGSTHVPVVEAEVTFLSTEEGGRSTAVQLGNPQAAYMPHLVVGDIRQRKALIDSERRIKEDYLGVRCRPADLILPPGAGATVWMELMHFPAYAYEELQPQTTFTIREGARIVGYGKILKRHEADAQ